MIARPSGLGAVYGCGSSLSVTPGVPWSEEEVKQANAMLEGAIWHTPPRAGRLQGERDIYEPARGSTFVVMTGETLVVEARVLQLALQVAQQDGKFSGLAALAAGQVGMEKLVWTNFHDNGVFEEYYGKTAGDMLQSFWCRLNLDDMSDCFQFNHVQAAIAKWLNLPQMVLPNDVAERVGQWVEHPLADFQEIVTLFLPTKLLGSYMNVSCNWYRLFRKGGAQAICRARNARGLLSCNRPTRSSYGSFCSHTCSIGSPAAAANQSPHDTSTSAASSQVGVSIICQHIILYLRM